MSNQPIFYIFINSDLSISKGQQTAQIVHITQIIVEGLVKKCYEMHPPNDDCLNYMKWKINPTCVILRATSKQLQILINMKGAKGFFDSGNRIIDNTLTIVGFYPTTNLEELVKDYKLF